MKLSRRTVLVLGALGILLGSVSSVCAAEGESLPDVSTANGSVKDMRFPLSAWSPELLAMIDAGPRYLKKDADFSVPPYPENDSDTTKVELQILKRYAAEKRTPEALKNIEGYADNIWLPSLPQIPEVVAVNNAAVFEVRYFVLKSKRDYARARPTQLAPDLTTVIPVPPHASYPSGHATQTRIEALVLGYIDPEHADAYDQEAKDIARGREIAGIHYPSDTLAGRNLADAVFASLIENAEFKTLIENAKKKFQAQKQ